MNEMKQTYLIEEVHNSKFCKGMKISGKRKTKEQTISIQFKNNNI